MRTTTIVLGLFLTTFGHAARLRRPVPVGILFPMFNTAAVYNPAGLPQEKATSIQGLYSPPPSNSAHNYAVSVASAGRTVGVEAGYAGTSLSGTLTHGAFAGAGAKFGEFSLGVGAIKGDLSNSSAQPLVQLGSIIDMSEVRLGFVIRNINSSASRFGAAVGYGTRRYALEANVFLPSFSGISSNTAVANSSLSSSSYVSAYTFAAGVAVYEGIFALSFYTAYITSYEVWDHVVTGAIWLGESVNLLVSFNSPNRVTAGMTVNF